MFVTFLALIALCNAASLPPAQTEQRMLPPLDSIKHFHQNLMARAESIVSKLFSMPNFQTDWKVQKYLENVNGIMSDIDNAEKALENDEPVLEALAEEKYVNIMKNLTALENKLKIAGGEKLAQYKAEYAKLNSTAAELKAEKQKEAEQKRINLEEGFVKKLTELSAKVEAIKTAPVASLPSGDSKLTYHITYNVSLFCL